LEAQQAALIKFAEAEGCRFLQTFTETESGADDTRPELAAAIALAGKRRAPIIVAKLDRLSREVHYISGLQSFAVVHSLYWRWMSCLALGLESLWCCLRFARH
jgi:DNA invertase Pin-like site-specific DNA recombinase